MDLKHLKEQCESLKPNVLNASGRRGRRFESCHSDSESFDFRSFWQLRDHLGTDDFFIWPRSDPPGGRCPSEKGQRPPENFQSQMNRSFVF